MKPEERAQRIAIAQLATHYGSNLMINLLIPLLERYEAKMHKLAERYCNGEIDSDTWDQETERALGSIHELFHSPVLGLFINSDPRGYALKISPEETRSLRAKEVYLQQDWGGYGILVPAGE